jgi:quercetin dioxygenase-like cupin family protein
MLQGMAHMHAGEGHSLWVLGELVTYKVTGEQTGGAYSLFEVETPPGGGLPPHVQHREDEFLYVLEGEYEFIVEGRTTRASAGAQIYVPKGNLHAHRNVGAGVGRLLATQTPGGLYERFFESLVFEDQPDVARILALAARYGIEITKGENHEA